MEYLYGNVPKKGRRADIFVSGASFAYRRESRWPPEGGRYKDKEKPWRVTSDRRARERTGLKTGHYKGGEKRGQKGHCDVVPR